MDGETQISPPVILEEKQQLVSADIGQNLFLACSTYGDPQPTTYWVLHDGTIVRPLTYSHTKVSVFGNGTLYLRDVQITESGKYECIATSSTGSEWRVVTLSVKRTETVPQITETSQQRTDVIYAGRLQLNCSAVGDPKPQIIWRLPSKALVDHGLQADGSEVGSDEEGDYTCYAENKLGKDKMHVHISVVTAVPRIQRPILSYAKVKPGRNVRFDLHANGSLDIRNVKLADAGEYVCMARNAAGEENKEYKLDIDGNPPIINGTGYYCLGIHIILSFKHL
uniref:Immunoglobulin superfamily, member 10 n=1 Tax=Sinocyclocheilus grahami TaxID=75366 RepID=A0A672NAG5_SINGR